MTDPVGLGLAGSANAASAPFAHPTPREFIAGFIRDHEGGLSLDPTDNGNWTGGREGSGDLVGSKFGVTAAALAKHRGTAAFAITKADIANLTLDEAVDVGMALYFEAPHFDLLPWQQVTASVVDMGWGAGPGRATMLLQGMIGTVEDGKLGTATVAVYAGFIAQHGLEGAARLWGETRNAYYDRIIAERPANAKYRNGWRNRTASFLPGTPWWGTWR